MLALIALAPAAAQVNAEVLVAPATEEGVSVGLSLGTTLMTGNVELFGVRGDLGAQWLRAFDEGPSASLWMRDRVLLSVKGAYQTYQGTPILDERLAHLRYTHMVVPRLGAEAFLQAQNDLALLLRWRLLAGAGVRFVALNEPRIGLWGGVGYMAERELREVDPAGPDAADVLNHRLTSFVAWRAVVVPDRLNWVNTVYLQPRLDDPTDLQFVDETSIDVSVNKVLSFTTGLRVRVDTQPPSAVESADLRWTTGLTLRWSKVAD